MIYSQKNTILAYTNKDCFVSLEIGGWLETTGMTLDIGTKILTTIKTDKNSDTPLFTIDTTTFIDSVLGKVVIHIPRASLNLTAGLYAYEITYQDLEGDSSTIQVGDFILEQSILDL